MRLDAGPGVLTQRSDITASARKVGMSERPVSPGEGAIDAGRSASSAADGGEPAFSCPAYPTKRGRFPTRTPRYAMPPTGLEAVYLEHRDALLRFLRARGAGEAAEDLVHDLWLKVAGRTDVPIANPIAYLYRAADLLMIDRYRSRRQADRRDQAWEDGRRDPSSVIPTPEREVEARQEAARVAQVLQALGDRKATVFRRARVEGVPQRVIATELGISLSTVESDLRDVTRALVKLKDEIR